MKAKIKTACQQVFVQIWKKEADEINFEAIGYNEKIENCHTWHSEFDIFEYCQWISTHLKI